MKRKITLAFSTLLFASLTLCAQNNYVHKIIVLNEGHYDYVNQVQTVPVTVGAYDPVTHAYVPFDSIFNARFATHVIVEGGNIYVAADNQLIRYDADNYQRLAEATVPGIRKLAVWNNQILVSRGEYLQVYNSYFQVYDKNNLNFVYELPVTTGPQYASEGIVVKDDIAYIAVNNGFDWGNEVGLIGRVDLPNQNYLNEIDLGATGKNPENIILDDNTIYTVNNTDYTTASISKIDISSHAVTTTDLMTTTGCGASSFASGYILFQVMGDNSIGRFSTSSLAMHDTLMIHRNIYGMAADALNNLMYVGETDYSTYGKILIYNTTGTLTDSFDVSVSPGNIALDIRSTAGVHESVAETSALWCYPNPAHDQTRIVTGEKKNQHDVFVLTDLAGRVLDNIVTNQSSFTLDMKLYEAGLYILQSSVNPGERIKISKQ